MRIERLIPLALGLLTGATLVMVMGRFSMKWAVFIIGAVAALAILIILGTMTKRLQGTLLFAAVATLPMFYDINFFWRDDVSFSVLANGISVNLFEVVLAPLAMLWLYEMWLDPKKRVIRFPRVWAVLLLALLFINLCSAAFIAREPFFAFSMVIAQIKCYLVMFFLANYVRDERTFRLLGFAFAAILIIEGLVVLEQRFLGVIFTAENLGRLISLESKSGTGTLLRLAGTLNHPNDLAMYLNLSIPWVTFMLIREKNLVPRLYLVGALLLAAAALVGTGSRGGWLGLAIALCICGFLWLRKQGKNPYVGMSVVGFFMVIGFTLLFAFSQTFQDRLTKGDAGAAEVRFPLMSVAMEMIKDRPIGGVGLNLYTREMIPYDRTSYFIAYRYNHPVHNTFLMVAAETGLPSLLLFCVFISVLIRDAFRVMHENEGTVAIVGTGMLGMLITWFVHNQVNLTAPFNDLTLWALFGVLAAARNFTERQQEASQAAGTPNLTLAHA